MNPLVAFFQAQLERLVVRVPSSHASGPKKPSLSELDGQKKGSA